MQSINLENRFQRIAQVIQQQEQALWLIEQDVLSAFEANQSELIYQLRHEYTWRKHLLARLQQFLERWGKQAQLSQFSFPSGDEGERSGM